MKNILLFCFLIFLSNQTFSQSTISLYTQVGVDSFPILFDSTELVGSLIIGYPNGDQLSDIHDLTPLSSIKKVYGNLRLRNTPHLKSLEGLHNIDSIFAHVEVSINNCDSLTNLLGLANLSYVGHEGLGFRIEDNAQLTSLDGLEKMIRMDDVPLKVHDNPQLNDVSGLKNLITCKDLNFARNNIQSLDFPSLTNIHRSLSLWQEDNLEDLSGLIALDTIGKQFGHFEQGKINIWACENILNLDGIENLYMSDFAVIDIRDNSSLENINALELLTTDTATIVMIEDNPNLTEIRLNNLKTGRHRIKIVNNTELLSISMNQLKYVDGDNVPGYSDMYDEDLQEPAPQGNDFTYGIRIDDNPNLQTINMPNLSRVEGDLVLRNNYSLTSFSSFSNLQVVNRHFLMKDLNSLPNLEGLEQLRWIGGDFEIRSDSTSSLTHLCDFVSLDSVNRAVALYSQYNLESLTGFESLKIIGRSFAMAGNDYISDLSPIYHLDSIGWKDGFGSFGFSECKNINAVNLPSSIKLNPNGSLYFAENVGLSSIAWPGLEELKFARILDNLLLENVHLPDLKIIGNENAGPDWMKMNNNSMLQHIDGFSNIKTVEDSLVFANNALLTDCEAICHIRDAGVSASKIKLYGNDFPCNTLADIEEHICDSLTAVFTPNQEKAAEILAYPNPAATEFRVSVPLQYLPSQLHVFDATGREVMQQQLQQSHQLLEMGDWQPGVYYLYLEKAEAWGKVVKF